MRRRTRTSPRGSRRNRIARPTAVDRRDGGGRGVEAQDAADSAKTIGIVGIVVGAVGLVFGVVAFMATRKRA